MSLSVIIAIFGAHLYWQQKPGNGTGELLIGWFCHLLQPSKRAVNILNWDLGMVVYLFGVGLEEESG